MFIWQSVKNMTCLRIIPKAHVHTTFPPKAETERISLILWSVCKVFKPQFKQRSVWSCSLNLPNHKLHLWFFRGVFHSCFEMLTRSLWILPQPPAIALLLITQSTSSKWHNLNFPYNLLFSKVGWRFLLYDAENHKSPFISPQAFSHNHFSPIWKKHVY